MLTVIASTEHELAALRKELRSDRRATSSFPQTHGELAMGLHLVGMGKQAGAKVRSLLAQRYAPSNGQAPSPDGLLLLGFAGAVDPALKSGDLVLASRYYRPELEQNPSHPDRREDPRHSPHSPPLEKGVSRGYLTPDPKMWRHAVEAAEGMEQTAAQMDSLTVDSLVTTPAAKGAVARTYSVGIVEMEDFWVASVARDAGVPFLSVRVVLDVADQTVPAYLLGLSRSRIKASFMSAAMPWRIPTLIRLARQVTIAQRALAWFALNFFAQANNDYLDLSSQATAPSGVPSGEGGCR